MDHDDPFVFAILIDAEKIKTIGHVHVELNRGDLVKAADGVLVP